MSEPDERVVFAALDGEADAAFAQGLLDRLLHEIADVPSPSSNGNDASPNQAIDEHREELIMVDIDIEDRPDINDKTEIKGTSGPGQPSTRRWWIGGIAAAAAALLIVAGIVAVNDSDDDVTVANEADGDAPGVDGPAPVVGVEQAEALMDSFVGALNEADAAAARASIGGTVSVGPDFVGWLVALDTTGVEFFDCTYQPGSVDCQTTMGTSHFFEQIHGQNVESRFSAALEDGLIVNPTWPAQLADLTADAEFRNWAQETHPELSDVMFDASPSGIIFTEQSGQSRMQLLPEYLASR